MNIMLGQIFPSNYDGLGLTMDIIEIPKDILEERKFKKYLWT